VVCELYNGSMGNRPLSHSRIIWARFSRFTPGMSFRAFCRESDPIEQPQNAATQGMGAMVRGPTFSQNRSRLLEVWCTPKEPFEKERVHALLFEVQG